MPKIYHRVSQLLTQLLLVPLLLSFCSNFVLGQNHLSTSRKSSAYIYIYKLGADDVLKFYRSPDADPDEHIFSNPIDSFKNDGYWENTLPPGNYVKAHADANKLKYVLIENHSAFIHLFDNDFEHRFAITDKLGNAATAALVTINGKVVAHDVKSNTWHFKHSKKENIVRVDYGGVSNFFLVKNKRDYDDERNWFTKLWASVTNVFKRMGKHRYKPSPYTGFMVFNKPMYKPNDTVKLKAFILNSSNKKPISKKQLKVSLQTYPTFKTIGTVSSYRDGGFEYSFVLGDSLKLTLDNTYTVVLQDPAGEEDNAIVRASFKYEEYELKSVQFNMRTDKTEHGPGNSLAVYLKATDENELPVPDGRVTLTLKTKSTVNYKNHNKTFIPDTLWVHKVQLDPVGETKVLIPDSIFPPAAIKYNIEARFLNSNNEQQYKEKDIEFTNKNFNIVTELSNDTLKALYQHNGKQTTATAFISALNDDSDTLSKVKVTLPAKIKINPYATEYNIATDSADTDIELKDFTANVAISGDHTADSVFVKIDNPRNLQFYYSVFSGDKLIDADQATQLFYRKAHTHNQVITVLVSYLWAGTVHTERGTIAYRRDVLNIDVKQPVSVYPGQIVKTDIVVTDVQGKPVANTDITAWAITRKFKYYTPPSVAYLGRSYAYHKPKPFFNVDEFDASGSLNLNWLRWSREMGLDSIEYYKFTNPATMYRSVEPAPDSVTQIAPFVVQNGDILPVHILYIDEKPVYFSQAQQLQAYSFKVSPGMHALRFRTNNLNLSLDSVMVQASKKLIISINADAYRSIKLPDTLTAYEANLINKYLITVNNNFEERKAIIQQNDRSFLLNPNGYANRTILTGPLSDSYSFYNRQGDPGQLFVAEPGYSYLFEPGLIKQKSLDTRYPFNKHLAGIKSIDNYNQYAITDESINATWQNYLDNRNSERELFTNEIIGPVNSGKLVADRQFIDKQKTILIKNVIIYRYDNPDFIRIYPGNTTNFGLLSVGKYRLLLLLKGDTYAIQENIVIKAYGINYYNLSIQNILPKDAVSSKISNIINNRTTADKYKDYDNNDALKLKEAFNEKYLNTHFTNTITGTVIANDDQLPIPGVTVSIKGTSIGTQTDMAGKFTLNVPMEGTLRVNFIGYGTKEIPIRLGSENLIVLYADSRHLNEVVVVAGGVSIKNRSIGSQSVIIYNELAGKVSGIQVIADSTKGIGVRLVLRGNRSTIGNNVPLIIIDGVIVPNSTLNSLSPDAIGDISVLNDAAALALYGSDAGNGVIIITTKPKSAKPVAADLPQTGGEQTLRKNFSDYAYWQPKLTTDEDGKVSFTSVFPDDITNWRTFIIGINGNRQGGFSEKQVKAYKPVSANFIAPQFAVAGDEMNLIGKVMNYNSTPASLSRSFSYNGKMLKQGNLDINNAHIDTLKITAASTDSLTFEYSIKRDNGYFDGERRKVPVVKQGVQETKGVFEALYRDTTVNLKFDSALGPVTFHAETSALPALAEEARKLREYKYLCNEQLASKLKGLLSEKRIKTFLNEPFKYERNINEVIKKIQGNRKSSGAWGWWKDSNEEMWISLHTVEALLSAQSMGYTVNLNQQQLTAYLVFQMESYSGEEKLACLQLLHKLGAKVDYAKYFDVIAREYASQKAVSNYNRFRLMLLKQQTGALVKTDSLLHIANKTLFGNLYWGEENTRFFDNSVQLSVIAYHIIKNEGKHPELLEKIRGYFMEQRKTGEWRNTYESALILETILPDLLKTDKQIKPATLTFKATGTETVTVFPYTTTLTINEVNVSKTGGLPVYITGYQQFWNSAPNKLSKDFIVDTWFEDAGNKISKLKGGKPIQLKAEVTVNGDADFVMIEIPIPAGCSYESKEQAYANNEVHREFFKEKVSIFCRKLKKGKYTFALSLMPRYNGSYTLNPAKAEQMYFPVFYGREGMKKVVIGE